MIVPLNNILNAVNNLITSISNLLQSLFVPRSGFLEEKFNLLYSNFSSKFGSVLQVASEIKQTFSNASASEFDGIKIKFSSNFYLSGLSGREFYLVASEPINNYAYFVKPWLSGFMIFLTSVFCLRKVVQLIRGHAPL